MAGSQTIYSYIDIKTGTEITVSEKKLTEIIAEDVETMFEDYEKKNGIIIPKDFDSMPYDRNNMLKVYPMQFDGNSCHIMVFEGYWIHSLGMLRLLLGREMGTRVYLEMDVSVIDTSYSMMFNRHFLNFDHLGICLSYYDHNSNPVDLIQKFFEFETQCGILLLNEACEYCFSDEKISQQVGKIGSYCGKKIHEVMEIFSPRRFVSGRFRAIDMAEHDLETLQKLEKQHRGILNDNIEKEIISDVQDQIRHYRLKPTKRIKRLRRN